MIEPKLAVIKISPEQGSRPNPTFRESWAAMDDALGNVRSPVTARSPARSLTALAFLSFQLLSFQLLSGGNIKHVTCILYTCFGARPFNVWQASRQESGFRWFPSLIDDLQTTHDWAVGGESGAQSSSPNSFNHRKSGNIFQVWSLLTTPTATPADSTTGLLALVPILLPNLGNGRGIIQLVV